MAANVSSPKISVEKVVVEKTMIIEFVGPTGGGKTTNCDEFVKALSDLGLRTATFADFKKWFYKSGLVTKVGVLARTVSKDFGKMTGFIQLLSTANLLSFDAIKRYFKLCIFNRALDRFSEKNLADVIILDQWIIQGIWSATIFRENYSEDVIKKLTCYYFPVDFVFYFQIDPKTASDRIGSRLTGRSRFDGMDNEKRLAETERFNNYLQLLFQNSECQNKKVFSTLDTPQQNREVFTAYFLQHLSNPTPP